MIKFFRKIRQNLLIENKFSKYLLYAIGEIVLVVVGILIALQINNNNNYNEQRSLEQEYLLSLQTEFEINLNKINESIQGNEKRIKAFDFLLTLFNKNVLDTVSNKDISQMFVPILGRGTSYLPSTGVLSDIISSGKLNMILNKNLRQNLASHESSLNQLNIQLNGAEFADENLRLLLYKEGSIRNILMDIGFVEFELESISKEIDNKQLFNSVEFENHLLTYSLYVKATNGSRLFGRIKAEIETILALINQELKK
tara:strand:+ start:1071 stop:1838 length:768 start_codon:yes stop_codon:yes gene_type:complete